MRGCFLASGVVLASAIALIGFSFLMHKLTLTVDTECTILSSGQCKEHQNSWNDVRYWYVVYNNITTPRGECRLVGYARYETENGCLQRRRGIGSNFTCSYNNHVCELE